MSCPGRTGATTRPAPVRVRSPAPSPELKIRCLSPRLVDEDVVMFECEKELEPPQASVGLGIPHAILEHATVSESAACLRPVVAGSNVPACPTAIALAEVDTHSDDDDDEEWEEEEEEEEDREIDHDLPSSGNATTGSLFNNLNHAKLAPSPPPRAAPASTLRFERGPIEVQVPPSALATCEPTGVKIEDEFELENGGLWIRREPTHIPGSFLQHPDRLGSESATSGGHPKSTSERIGTGSKESSESRGTESGCAQPEPEGEHEISINLASSAETASLELHLTSGSVDASKEHSPAPPSESTSTFNFKVTMIGPGRFSISAAWERGGAR